jgi:aminomethyltransferase
MAELLQTRLYEWHLAHGARMVPFAGWWMPLQYRGIVEEHGATRNACTITDVSHMGRLRFEGAGAGDFLNSLITRNVAGLKLNHVRYSLVTNARGGILDDVVVGYFANPYSQPFYLMVVNAANRAKILEWIQRHREDWPSRSGSLGHFLIDDLTRLTAMFAIQGPQAAAVLEPLVDCDLASMGYYRGCVVRLLHPKASRQGGILTRTGYTGEDGFELIVAAEIAVPIWEVILDLGRAFGLIPAGLGARDTLRLEAALPLYGNELTEEVNPWEVGLDFACELDGRDFPGCEALLRLRNEPLKRRLVCLEILGRRIARSGYPIKFQDQTVGVVTSGNYSPTLQKPIAMGFVLPELAEPGTEVQVEIRGQLEPARVVPRPFYRRPRPRVSTR